MWPLCGYNEIQEARRKNVLIDYERLQGLLGASSYEQLRNSHKGCVEEYSGDGVKDRQEEWTASIAVGSKSFIDNVKAGLGLRGKGRHVIEGGEGYQLRESPAYCKALFTYFWDVKAE